MPVYQCIVPARAVAPELRARIAAELTRIHCDATGVPASLVQVLFLDVPPGAAFTGGQPSDMSNIVGHILAGRSPEVRGQLFARINDAWTAITGLPAERLKITLFEVPLGSIMQGGRMMSDPATPGTKPAGA